MTYNTNGVLDRITDGKYATILEEDANKEYVIKVEYLPYGAKEGDWLDLKVENDSIEKLAINKTLTDSKRNRIENKMSRLKKRSRSNYKK